MRLSLEGGVIIMTSLLLLLNNDNFKDTFMEINIFYWLRSVENGSILKLFSFYIHNWFINMD